MGGETTCGGSEIQTSTHPHRFGQPSGTNSRNKNGVAQGPPHGPVLLVCRTEAEKAVLAVT